MHLAHKRLKQSIPRFLRESSTLNILTAPIIYSMVVPIALIDAAFSLYQGLCFPLYGISHVRRSAYIAAVDRRHLAYLNAIEKFNCMYCGYANGVLAYVREIAGRTEQYWCPIRRATVGARPTPTIASSSITATPRGTTGGCRLAASLMSQAREHSEPFLLPGGCRRERRVIRAAQEIRIDFAPIHRQL